MTFLLRQLVRSRRLRAMGVLAWLMLAMNSLVIALPQMVGMPSAQVTTVPMTMPGTPIDPVGPMAAVVHAGVNQADCCGELAAHHGACAAICITALTPAAAVALTPLALTAAYAMPRRISPPSLVTAPPLRPPAA